ncbi:Rab family GTPase [Entamoeba marina]
MIKSVGIYFVGDSGVGKTSIIQRYLGNEYCEEPHNIGVKKKIIHFDHMKIYVSIYDQLNFFEEKLENHDINVLIGTFAVGNHRSFDTAKVWVDYVDKNLQTKYKYIVGSQIDNNSRIISYDDGVELANHLNAKYYEVSAKYNIGIYELFDSILKNIHTGELKNGLIHDKQNCIVM